MDAHSDIDFGHAELFAHIEQELQQEYEIEPDDIPEIPVVEDAPSAQIYQNLIDKVSAAVAATRMECEEDYKCPVRVSRTENDRDEAGRIYIDNHPANACPDLYYPTVIAKTNRRQQHRWFAQKRKRHDLKMYTMHQYKGTDWHACGACTIDRSCDKCYAMSLASLNAKYAGLIHTLPRQTLLLYD